MFFSIFLARLRDGDAAASQIAVPSYSWCLSRKRRNAAVYYVAGNPISKMPEVVKSTTGHERSRSFICAGCDSYLGIRKWNSGSARTLLGDSTGAQKLRQQMVSRLREYDPESPYLATALCATCVKMVRTPEVKVLHLQQQRLTTLKRLGDAWNHRNKPQCKAYPTVIDDCDLCSRVSTYSAADLGRPRGQKRKSSGDLQSPRRGRPKLTRVGRKSKTAPSSSLHNAGAGGGRPLGEVKCDDDADLEDPTYYDVELDLLYELAESVTTDVSTAGVKRLASTLRKAGQTVEPNAAKVLDSMRHIFDEQFVTELLPTEPHKKCSLMHGRPRDAEEEMADDSDEDDEKGGPCNRCRHEVTFTSDICKTMRTFVEAQKRRVEDVALLKIGIDGGGKSLKVMAQILFKDDFLLQPPDELSDQVVQQMDRGTEPEGQRDSCTEAQMNTGTDGQRDRSQRDREGQRCKGAEGQRDRWIDRRTPGTSAAFVWLAPSKF